MKERRNKLFIQDILSAIEKIGRYTEELNYKEFEENELIVDAVLRNIEIIGEASKNLDKEIRNKYDDISWKKMIGLRNIAAHEYFGVDLNIIWNIIKKNLPETKPKIEQILKDFK